MLTQNKFCSLPSGFAMSQRVGTYQANDFKCNNPNCENRATGFQDGTRLRYLLSQPPPRFPSCNEDKCKIVVHKQLESSSAHPR